MLSLPYRGRGEAGSGTAIGVAVIYPMLILVIVVVHAIIDAARTEYSLQTAADRAARAASLCCERVGYPSPEEGAEGGAVAVAKHRVEEALSSAGHECAAAAKEETDVYVFDFGGTQVTEPPDPLRPGAKPALVPPGGTVQVHVTCTLPAGTWGSRWIVGPAGVQRHAVGRAVIDPFRQRQISVPWPPPTP